MRRAKRRDPVMFVRSPIMMKFDSERMTSGSRPLYLESVAGAAGECGLASATAAAMALMWCGVVPQQPPTTFSRPSRANWPRTSAICSGVSSYSPSSFGSPALG